MIPNVNETDRYPSAIGSPSLKPLEYREALSRPVSLITVAGNIMTDFNDVIAVGNDEKTTYHGIKTPSIAIGSLSVSGK